MVKPSLVDDSYQPLRKHKNEKKRLKTRIHAKNVKIAKFDAQDKVNRVVQRRAHDKAISRSRIRKRRQKNVELDLKTPEEENDNSNEAHNTWVMLVYPEFFG